MRRMTIAGLFLLLLCAMPARAAVTPLRQPVGIGSQLIFYYDTRDGFTPLLPTTTTFADERDGRDPPLDRILAWERTPGATGGRWTGTLAIRNERVALTLTFRQDGDTWTGTIDSDDFGLKGAALKDVRWMRGELRATWDAGGAWELRARSGADLLIGTVTRQGNVCPIVLVRPN